jgi:hypothetical protein
MFSKTKSTLLIALVIFGLVGVVPGLFAQATDGVILGTVTDSTQAVIPNAMVTATNRATGVKYTATTNSLGDYRINNVPVGTYDLEITSSGMAPKQQAVLVELNRTTTQNVIMQVTAVNAEVVVQEAPPLIDSSTSQLESTFKADQAVNQPMAGNFINDTGVLNLSLLAPGVTQSGGMGYGEGPSVGGQRQTNNAFFVDGVDNNRHDVTGPTVTVPNDSVAQFSILENQFSPEFGGASGGIFNILTNTGTNNMHGSVYEYFNNRNLNALDGKVAAQGFPGPSCATAPTNPNCGVRIPRNDYNRVGGTIGGPIIKNKLFYFGDYEYSPEGQASTPGSPIVGPTAAGFSTIATLPGISTTNLGILQKYLAAAPVANAPSITVGGVSIPTGSVNVSGPSYFNKHNIVTSVDYDLSNSDKIRGRYIYNRYTSIDTNAQLPVFYTTVPDNRHLFSLSEFHTFSPTTLNEFRLSYSRKNNNFPVGNFTFPGLDQFPDLVFDDLNLQLGPDSSSPQGYIQGQLQANENFTKTFAKHTVKAGYQFLDVIASNSFIQRARGDYDYSAVDLYLHDLSPDSLGERSVGVTGGTPAGYLFHSLYVNDDFRVKSNLTLNLGLRYEYMTVPVLTRYQKFSAPADVPGLITFAEPTPQKTNFAPKVGFAWTPSGKTEWAVRGGFSINYDLTYNNLNINAKPAYFQQTEDVNLHAQSPNFLKGGGLGPSNQIVITTDPVEARAAVSSFMPNEQIRPYSINYTFSIQRSFGNNYTIEARYLATKGVHLFVQDQLNRISNITPTNSLPTYFTMPSLATLASLPMTLGGLQNQLNAMTGGHASNSYAAAGFPSTITAYEPIGNSKYNGLALQLVKRFANNFGYTAAFTWSHALDDSTATVFSTELTPRRGQDFGNLRNDWSTSALDRRFRFTLAPAYDFKPFSNGNWLLKNVVGNWNITGSYTFQSPEYATVQSGVDSNLNNDTAGDRAVVNPSGQALLGTGVTPYNAAGQARPLAASSTDIVAYVANNANARYVQAGFGSFPNAGRNTYPLPRTDDVDFQLMKRFNVTEKTRFEVAGQIFNIFNHPQFTGDLLNDVYPNQNNTTRSFLLVNNPEFGHFNDGFFTSNPRQITIVGRIVF